MPAAGQAIAKAEINVVHINLSLERREALWTMRDSMIIVDLSKLAPIGG
jgi:hypothetical protein